MKIGVEMKRLIALPVNGDAFLLQSTERSILVDGGTRSARLAEQLKYYRVDHLDIVVCTHADSDHAGGLVEILDVSSVTVGEFWLPGSWLQSLPVLLPHPEQVVEGIVQEAKFWGDRDPADDSHEKAPSDSIIGAGMRHRHTDVEKNHPLEKPRKNGDGRAGLDWLKEWADTAEGCSESKHADAKRVFRNGENEVNSQVRDGRISSNVASTYIGLIKTAERIREIALQAIRHNVGVRWFDFGAFRACGYPSGGEPDLLIPLNSVELLSPPAPAIGLSYLARLTPYNRECLVFLSPGYDEPDSYHRLNLNIVFTGDSPLGDGPNFANSWLVWPSDISTKAIATAPHHGSENNAYAYDHLTNVVDVEVWLRSGGSAWHPGRTYRNISPHERYCTHCPRLKIPRQAIDLYFFDSRVALIEGHNCVC